MPGSWLPLAILGLPWFLDTSLPSLPPSGLVPSVCICVQIPFISKDTSHWIRTHPNPVRPHLDLITSAKTQFPNKVTFPGTRG